MRFLVPLSLPLVLAATPLHAATIGGNAGPEHNYVCPHADGQPALECFFDAVQHLYTMCRNVKSIEILEFGYEKSAEGTNGAKTEYCLDKQKQNIERPYRAALKDSLRSKPALEALRALHEQWLSALTGHAWRPGESDADYKARVAKPYEEFTAGIASVRTSIAAAQAPAATVKAAKAKKPDKASKPTIQAKKH
jgi:hypothetical protein